MTQTQNKRNWQEARGYRNDDLPGQARGKRKKGLKKSLVPHRPNDDVAVGCQTIAGAVPLLSASVVLSASVAVLSGISLGKSTVNFLDVLTNATVLLAAVVTSLQRLVWRGESADSNNPTQTESDTTPRTEANDAA